MTVRKSRPKHWNDRLPDPRGGSADDKRLVAAKLATRAAEAARGLAREAAGNCCPLIQKAD